MKGLCKTNCNELIYSTQNIHCWQGVWFCITTTACLTSDNWWTVIYIQTMHQHSLLPHPIEKGSALYWRWSFEEICRRAMKPCHRNKVWTKPRDNSLESECSQTSTLISASPGQPKGIRLQVMALSRFWMLERKLDKFVSTHASAIVMRPLNRSSLKTMAHLWIRKATGSTSMMRCGNKCSNAKLFLTNDSAQNLQH